MNNPSRTRATYSPALRERSVWKVIGPVLAASSDTVDEARTIQSSDFTFQQENSAQCLQILLITQSSLQESEKQNTGLRLRHFTSSSDPASSSRKAIAFLLSEEPFNSASRKYNLDGLLALQVLMFETLTAPLPVISISDAPSLFQSVDEYMMNIEDIPVAGPTLGDSVALLAHTTSDYPRSMDEQTHNVLSDLFPSFRKLSAATRIQEGQRLLVEYLGQDIAEKIVKFWQEDVLRD
ncbi:uncharacterized protein BDV17DRAFT_184058 [Aspergillus undulatus]|uniref:uncharacterized protein n=1 Tax=Aspergillus undulatus TaxID=1810928 RepID=UPI003CCCFE66